MSVVLVKNITTIDKNIEDLGIIIPGSSIINLTETYEYYEIVASNDLKKEITDGNLIINDGIVDLNIENSLKHIDQESLYEDDVKIYRIVDNTESITYSTSWQNKLTLDVNLEDGNYLLNWSYEIKNNLNDLNSSCQTRVLINTNNICTNIWPYSVYQFYSGTDVGKLTGTVLVQIDFRRQGFYQPVYIRKVIISLTKM